MGTTPFNFPPDASMEIGQHMTGTMLNISGPTVLLPTTFFTAPISGLYEVGGLLRVLFTDGTGTIDFEIATPTNGTVSDTQPVTEDSFINAGPIWLNAGGRIQASATPAGVTAATSYNLYVTVERLF
jgi:hypothetical protein